MNHSSVSKRALFLAMVAAPALLACASKPETKPAAAGPARPFVEQHPAVPQEAPSITLTPVHIAPDIVQACGLADADSYFAFDSARLNDEDVRVLNALGTCFTSGPLKGRKMKLVGRADPRGGEDYNMTLGQHRADSVEKYLVSRGLGQSMIDSTSRGKLDAVGTDEPTWAHDRRVDVLLD